MGRRRHRESSVRPPSPDAAPAAKTPPWVWRSVAILLAILTLSVLLRSLFLAVPLERDEGEYSYIAWLMNAGGVPYRDAFNQKTPGTFFAYFAVMKLFGFTTRGIHFGAALWCAGTACFVYLTGKRLHSAAVGLVAAAIFSVGAISPAVVGTAANTEMFMALPIAAAAFLASGFVSSDGSVRAALLCGLFVGWGACFKQVALADGGFFLLVIAVTSGDSKRRAVEVVSRIAAFAGGALAALVPPAAYLVWHGALSDFIKDTVTLNAGYLGIVPLAAYPSRFMAIFGGSFIPYLWPHLLVGMLGLAFALTGKGELRGARWFLPGWLAFALIGIVPGGIFREHYFFQVLAPLSLLGALGVVSATRQIRWVPLRIGVRVAVAVLPLALGFRPLFSLDPDQIANALYPGSPFVESKVVARIVAENSAPQDPVLVFGSEPQILFYAGRRSATKFILTYPLMMDVPGAEQRQVEMFEDVKAANPRVVVLVNDPMSHLAGSWSSPYIFDNLKTFVTRDYKLIYPPKRPDGSHGQFSVYRRKD